MNYQNVLRNILDRKEGGKVMKIRVLKEDFSEKILLIRYLRKWPQDHYIEKEYQIYLTWKLYLLLLKINDNHDSEKRHNHLFYHHKQVCHFTTLQIQPETTNLHPDFLIEHLWYDQCKNNRV